MLAGFPGQLTAPVTLSGHFDVVQPHPDDGQFVPRIDGDYLWGRGAADMKTVVASYLVWMADQQSRPGPKPPVMMLLSCCEENGSHRPNHMSSVLDWLQQTFGIEVRFAVVGERTGELEWMVAFWGKTFYCGDILILDSRDWCSAGSDGLTFDVDRAASAQSFTAGIFGAGELECVSEDP